MMSNVENSSTPTSMMMGRRKFLTAAGVATAGVTLSTLPFKFSRSAAALTGSRSLVCVFLQGGADSFNMYVPRDHNEAGQSHAVYSATRGRFAVPAGDLLPIGDGSFGLNPGLPGMAALANQGDLAVVANVGPLARPMTKTDYLAGRSLPQSLFAHDAQQKLWQTGRPTLASSTGWGGALAAAVGGDAPVAPSFSLSGSNRWQASVDARYSRLSPTIDIALLDGYNPDTRQWIPSFEGVHRVLHENLALARSSQNEFDQVAAETIQQSILTTEQLQSATADSAENDVGMADIEGNRLGMQLREVARLIKNRETLNMPRQMFFVRMGGWDTHSDQDGRFPALMAGLDAALVSFQQSMADLGVTDSVTTFTASDFGRTLTSNGDGTDHAWGGHAFVVGGAVKPGRYGTLPDLRAENVNADDVGDGRNNFAGRLIPTTSVSQHAATLARWMGLTDSQLTTAFPDLPNFASSDLGYL